MIREPQMLDVVRQLDLTGCPTGPVLQPLSPPSTEASICFGDWETPLAPWGGFRVDSGLAVVRDEGRTVLAFTDAYSGSARGRALVAQDLLLRDGRIVAVVKPMAVAAAPHMDRDDCLEALVGVIFRVQTSRAYYQFALEGRRRAVLYRRKDDEWFELALVHRIFTTLPNRGALICWCPEMITCGR